MLAFILLTTCVGVATGAASVQIGGVTFNGLERTSPLDSNVYYGIEFANAGRWKNPVPVDPTTFSSPYDASVNNKPMCYQNCFILPDIGCVDTMDEDCLTLNIYTPSSATPSSNLPVLFFVHGGGFTIGAGAAIWYDSDKLVREGVIVVTFNYRLGIFGYLGSGNYGLRDQIEALKWVYNYISNFGGNPNQITAMGQSAGTLAVDLLLANAESSCLIQRVILISAPFSLSYRTPAEGQYMQSTFESKAGCTVGDAMCDALSPEVLLGYQNDQDVTNYNDELLSEILRWGPVIDDDLVPDHPYNLHKNGLLDVKDTLLGTTRDEGVPFFVTGTTPTDIHYLVDKVAALDPQLNRTIWRYQYVPDTRYTLADIGTDFLFRCVGREVAQLIGQQKTVYRYEFDDQFPDDFSIFPGLCEGLVCHANDLFYIFGTFNYVPIPFTDADKALSDVIVKAFTRFTKGQSPTPNTFTDWRRDGKWFYFLGKRWSYILQESNQFSSILYSGETWKCNAMSWLTSYNPVYTPAGN